jgi:hypothetical protein
VLIASTREGDLVFDPFCGSGTTAAKELLAAVIADTHLPRRARALPEDLMAHLERAEEDEDGLMLLNPGSSTDRRRQPRRTFALLRAQAGEARAEIVPL